MKKFLMCSIVALSFPVLAGITIGGKIEPLYEIEESGNFAESGSSDIGLHRAQLSLKFKEKTPNDWMIRGKLNVDMAEDNFDEVIHNAYASIKFADPIKVTVGRKKPPFSVNASMGASKLPTIYRSWTSKHLNDDLGIAGYLDGLTIDGSLLNDLFFYSVALNHYEHDRRDGFSASQLYSLPYLSLGANPLRGVTVRWDMALPYSAVSYEDGSTEELRLFLHDWSVSYSAPRIYRGSLEAFLGADTTDAQTLRKIHEEYDDNVRFSLQMLNEFYTPQRNGFGLFAALGGEYLNGLNHVNGKSENRDFYWAGVIVAGGTYEDLLKVQLSCDTRLDEKFRSTGNTRIAVQVGIRKEFSLKGGKE